MVEPDVTAMSTQMLKAMAHPIRRQLLRELAARDYALAADLAAALGQPANVVSFHLRTLAEAGFIVEAPEHARDRRDRVWARTTGFELGSPERPLQDEALGNVVMSGIVHDHQELVRRLTDWAPDYTSGRAPEIHGTFQRRTLRPSLEEFDALLNRVDEAIDAALDTHVEGPETRTWELDIIAADDQI